MCLLPRPTAGVSFGDHDSHVDLQDLLACGHAPTLVSAFLYSGFSCCIWGLNGAMAPFITDTYHIT
jgi:hypothetical protein